MEFTIIIDAKDLESVISQRVKEEVARLTKSTVDAQIYSYKSKIESVVNVYLEKRITTEEVKTLIDITIEKRLRELE